MNHNHTIDILKGISIIMIVITHYAWTQEQRLNPIFPFIINMAVPIFIILSGYVGALSYQRHKITTATEAYSIEQLRRKFIRYTAPFMILVLCEIFDPNVVIGGEGFLDKLRWFLNGTNGQGSYYYPLLVQLIFLFRVIYFVIERKGRRGLWICLIINAVYELLKWSYGMNEECYRLLIFRYIFLIAAGVYACRYELNLLGSILMTVIGAVFIGITAYDFYSPKIVTYWTGTCFIASLFIIPHTADGMDGQMCQTSLCSSGSHWESKL